MKTTINNTNKTITVSQQAFLKATDEDLALVKKYQSIGYEVIVKESKRVKGDKLSDADIRTALKDDKEALNTYLDLKKKNFFSAKSWYVKNYKK